MSRHFFLSRLAQSPRVHNGAEFSNWLRRVLWALILSGRSHGTRLWNRLDVKWCGELSSEVAVRNMMLDIMKSLMTQSLKISVILHSFVRVLLWCIYIYIIYYIYFAYSQLQCWCWMLPIEITRATPTAFDSWVTALFVGLHRGRTGDAKECKCKFFYSGI